MTPLRAASLAALLASAVAAALLAVRRREHVPAAVALSLLGAFNLAQLATVPATTPTLVYLDGAVMLAASAVVPGLAVFAFLSPRLRWRALAAVVAAWVLLSVAMAVVHPRGPELQRWYLAADLAGLVVAAASIVTWAWWAKGRASPGSTHAVALALPIADLALLLLPYGPWRASVFAGRWDLVQVVIVVFFAALAAAQVIAWQLYSPSR